MQICLKYKPATTKKMADNIQFAPIFCELTIASRHVKYIFSMRGGLVAIVPPKKIFHTPCRSNPANKTPQTVYHLREYRQRGDIK